MPDYELMIKNKNTAYYPPIIEPITFTEEMDGSPSKLEFTVIKGAKLSFQEGDMVTLRVNGKNYFKGYVFTKSRDKDHHIGVTAYDQIRYLKNKDIRIFENMKASDIFKSIVRTQGLRLGRVDDTRFRIKSYIGKDKSFMDMIYENLDTTVQNTQRKYIIYDSFGRLNLRNIDNLEVDSFILTDTNAENLDYTSSIDEEVYNKIILTYEDEDTKKREFFIAKDDSNVGRWGLLQYFEEIENRDIGQIKANTLLELHNRKKRSLDVKGIKGNLDIRAGFRVLTMLNLGDIILQNYLIVESLTMEFSGGQISMDLKLIGGGFSA